MPHSCIPFQGLNSHHNPPQLNPDVNNNPYSHEMTGEKIIQPQVSGDQLKGTKLESAIIKRYACILLNHMRHTDGETSLVSTLFKTNHSV